MLLSFFGVCGRKGRENFPEMGAIKQDRSTGYCVVFTASLLAFLRDEIKMPVFQANFVSC
jgi:hypothetical protein